MQLQESRNRSIVFWNSLEETFLFSQDALGSKRPIEVIREILAEDFFNLHNILRRGNSSISESPFANAAFVSVEEELKRIQPFREKLLQLIYSFNNNDFEDIQVVSNSARSTYSLAQLLSRILQKENEIRGQLLFQFQMFKQKNILAA